MPPADGIFRLSWSKLKTLEECRAKGWLYSQGKFEALRDNRPFFPGTVLDRAMRMWLEQESPQSGTMPGMVTTLFDREEAAAPQNGDGVARWKNLSDRAETLEKCREAACRLEPILFEHVVPFDYQVAARFEVQVTVPWGQGNRLLYLTGEMDLIVKPPVGLRIYDLKMTENEDYWRQTFPQLTFYGLAAAFKGLGYPDATALIQPMCTQRFLLFDFTADHYQEMLARIVQAAEYWWKGDHLPKAGNDGCAYCPARNACPKFVVAGNRRLMNALPVTTS
jgi:hypothetical protein